MIAEAQKTAETTVKNTVAQANVQMNQAVAQAKTSKWGPAGIESARLYAGGFLLFSRCAEAAAASSSTKRPKR